MPVLHRLELTYINADVVSASPNRRTGAHRHL